METIVQRAPIKVDKDQNLSHALALMEKEHISRLLVTDEGFVVGILTEEDIANRFATGRERKLKATQIHVSAAMSKDLVVISLNADFKDAARIMLEYGFSSLPVVEDDEIVGLITKTDLVRKLLDSEKKVGDFYTKDPVLVNPADTLVFARKLMLENSVHRLLVTDKGLLVGILTERDIARGLKTFRKALDKGTHQDIKGLRVEHLMSREPLTVKPESTVGEAVTLMLENGISGLPVIDRNFGVLTKTDLVRGIADSKLP